MTNPSLRRLARAVVRLYPRPWRDRYGRELEALLDDLDLRAVDVWNVLSGALAMRISALAPLPIGLAVAGALAGAVVSLRQPSLYQSSAMVRVESQDRMAAQAVLDIFRPGADLGGETEVRPSRVLVLIDDDRSAPPSVVLRLASFDEQAGRAQRITRQLVDLLATKAAARREPVAIETLSAATLPTAPSPPNHLAFAGSGGGVGLLLGGAMGWLRRRSASPSPR